MSGKLIEQDERFPFWVDGEQIGSKKFVYLYYSVRYSQRMKILSDLDLIQDCQEHQNMHEFLESILTTAHKRGVFRDFYLALNKGLTL